MPDLSTALSEQGDKTMRWLWLSLFVIGVDQLTKMLVSSNFTLYEFVPLVPSVNITLLHNNGAAFSLLNDAGGWQRWLFVFLALAISGMIVAWLRGLDDKKPWLACALALVLGGALGNLWDRVQLGYVIDFVDVYYQQWHWPAFNIADSAITLGAIMLIIDAFRSTD